jgi:carbonic anhydrase
MDQLIEGFRRFRESYWRENRELFEALTRGQAPRAMVIGCSDSRVDPQMIFGQEPGEIFVVRNIANLVPPFQASTDHHGTSAALEFAVRSLGVSHLIVLGHAHCGGIHALLQGPAGNPGDFVLPWMRIATAARERALAAAGGDIEAAQRLCEQEGVRLSLGNLMTFPWVKERVEDGRLALHGFYYDMDHGDLLVMDAQGRFRSVVAEGTGAPSCGCGSHGRHER